MYPVSVRFEPPDESGPLPHQVIVNNNAIVVVTEYLDVVVIQEEQRFQEEVKKFGLNALRGRGYVLHHTSGNGVSVLYEATPLSLFGKMTHEMEVNRFCVVIRDLS